MGAAGAETAPGERVLVPLGVRIRFAHAAVQWVADDLSARILHIKGAALDRALVGDRSFTDADVLVSPEDLPELLARLESVGWELINSFTHGSPFEHSATLRHAHFGLLDVHRLFPGIGLEPQRAFDELWSEHETTAIGGMGCPVPASPAQALVLLLHAARSASEPKAAHDVELVWIRADEEARAQVRRWVERLDAELAFSVITGRLDEHLEDPAHDLWAIASQGGSRLQEWRARIKAVPGWRAKTRLAARSLLVNVEHLELVRGRPVSRREVAVEFFARPIRGLGEELELRRGARLASKPTARPGDE